MIAAPSDVEKQRRIIRDVVHDWNSANSEREGIVLLPVSWDTDSAPQLGERPQEIINDQILRDADALVAVFGSRIGTPTGNGPSGTVEEIREHHAAGKLTMIYFWAPTSWPIDVDRQQLEALNVFRSECESWGLIETFKNDHALWTKFSRQLATHIHGHSLFQSARSDGGDISVLAERSADPEALTNDAKRLLYEASEDERGQVLAVTTHDGFSVGTNGREFVDDQKPRTWARWKRVIRELMDAGYLEQRDADGEILAVTAEGYEAVENMGLIL
jgi:hypothetical protein